MSDRQVIVGWLIVFITLAICAVDVAICISWGQESSFSRTLRAAGEKWGALPFVASFAAGALIGHCWL